MPLGSVWARNADLNACYGSGHAAAWPDTISVHLWNGDPRDGGEELPSDGGYASVTVANTDAVWPDAVGGVKASEPVDFGTPTGPWGDVARFVVLKNPDNGNHLDVMELAKKINVTGAGFGPVQVIIEIATDEVTD